MTDRQEIDKNSRRRRSKKGNNNRNNGRSQPQLRRKRTFPTATNRTSRKQKKPNPEEMQSIMDKTINLIKSSMLSWKEEENRETTFFSEEQLQDRNSLDAEVSKLLFNWHTSPDSKLLAIDGTIKIFGRLKFVARFENIPHPVFLDVSKFLNTPVDYLTRDELEELFAIHSIIDEQQKMHCFGNVRTRAERENLSSDEATGNDTNKEVVLPRDDESTTEEDIITDEEISNQSAMVHLGNLVDAAVAARERLVASALLAAMATATANAHRNGEEDETENPEEDGSLFGENSTEKPEEDGSLYGENSTENPEEDGSLFGENSTDSSDEDGSLFGENSARNPNEDSSSVGEYDPDHEFDFESLFGDEEIAAANAALQEADRRVNAIGDAALEEEDEREEEDEDEDEEEEEEEEEDEHEEEDESEDEDERPGSATDDDEDEEFDDDYEIDFLLFVRKYFGLDYYMVKWKNYPYSDCNFEPRHNLRAQKLIRQFRKCKKYDWENADDDDIQSIKGHIYLDDDKYVVIHFKDMPQPMALYVKDAKPHFKKVLQYCNQHRV